MSNTLNTFQIQLDENLSTSLSELITPTTSTLVYNIVSLGANLASETISATYTTIGGLTIMTGAFSGTTSNSTWDGAYITITFSAPVFTSTPKLFLEFVYPSDSLLVVNMVLYPYSVSTNSFSFQVAESNGSGYPSNSNLAVNFMLIGS